MISGGTSSGVRPGNSCVQCLSLQSMWLVQPRLNNAMNPAFTRRLQQSTQRGASILALDLPARGGLLVHQRLSIRFDLCGWLVVVVLYQCNLRWSPILFFKSQRFVARTNTYYGSRRKPFSRCFKKSLCLVAKRLMRCGASSGGGTENE